MINDKIVLAAMTYDLDGVLFFDRKTINYSGSRLNNVSRRATRTATLDGGSVLYDTGHSASDRNITVQFDDYELSEKAKTFVEKYNKVWVFLNDGAYIANPKSFSISRGTSTINLEVIESA